MSSRIVKQPPYEQNETDETSSFSEESGTYSSITGLNIYESIRGPHFDCGPSKGSIDPRISASKALIDGVFYVMKNEV